MLHKEVHGGQVSARLRRNRHRSNLVGQQRGRSIVGQRDRRATLRQRHLKRVVSGVDDVVRLSLVQPCCRGDIVEPHNHAVAVAMGGAVYRVCRCREGDRCVSSSQIGVVVIELVVCGGTGRIVCRGPITIVDCVVPADCHSKEVATSAYAVTRPDSVEADNLVVASISLTCRPRWVPHPFRRNRWFRAKKILCGGPHIHHR